jgi:3-oxoacyl-[acyl-carrier-protein] synthase II
LKRRVVISGCGVVSPIGNSRIDFWNSLSKGISGGRLISGFDTEGYGTKIAAEVIGFTPHPSLDMEEVKFMDNFAQYALTAALESWEHAGVDHRSLDPGRVGIIVGSSNGGDQFIHSNYMDQLKGEAVDPIKHIGGMINSAPIKIAKKIKATGPAYSISTACASGTNAIGEAYRYIQSNHADVMIAGGTDDGIQPLNVAGLDRIHAMSRNNDQPSSASRPFSEERDGFLMGSGAGMVVLEEYQHAVERGAVIMAEIIGYGSTTDAYHITAPHPEGLLAAVAMEEAIAEADIHHEQIDYINAHGTGTKLNDEMEAKAIHKVFGQYGNRIPVNAIKSMTGHMLGGSGAVEVISTVLTIVHDLIPATVNTEPFDEKLELNVIRGGSLAESIKVAMTNSFGFGGHNASLILQEVKGDT